MNSSTRPLRVLGLSDGHHRRTMSGVPGFLFDGLDRTYAEVERVDYSVRGVRRWALAAATFGPDRPTWVGRFHAGRQAHRALSASLARRCRGRGDYDIAVQVHGWAWGQPRPYTLFADQTRIMAERGFPGWLPLPTRDRAWLLRSERELYRKAAHVFAMGEPTRASLVDDYDLSSDRVSVVGGGLNLDALPALHPLPAAPSILFVGRDFERKGGPVLLRAFARVRTAVPGATLHIAGPTRRFIEPGVVGHGPVGRARLMELYRHARIFCMPSLYEPYGLVFIEAMAHAVPCVGSTAQSIPEILGHGAAGLLPRTGDEPALADALVCLLRDEDLANRLGLTGRRRVEERHSWGHVATRMRPVLTATADARQAQPGSAR